MTDYSDDKEAYLGLYKSTAVKMTPDMDVLFATPHEDAFNVAKKEDIENIKDSDTVLYCARNFKENRIKSFDSSSRFKREILPISRYTS